MLFLRPAMQSETEYISDSEPERVVASELAAQRVRNPRRRTSDERPGLSSAGEDSDVQVSGRTKATPAEVVVLSSASEGEAEDEPILSKYFNPPTSPSKRRRVPASTGSVGASSIGWPFTSGRIGSRSPPALARSLSQSPAFPPNDQPQSLPLPPVASTSKHFLSLSYSSLESDTSLASTNRPPRSPTKSSPSVSALDLLRSGTVQHVPFYNDDDLPLEHKSTTKAKATTTKSKGKGKGKLSQSASFSSVEILGGSPNLDPDLDLQDDRMSVSSSGSDSLLPPKSWASRFSFGTSNAPTARLSATAKAKAKPKVMEQGSGSESSQSRRKKPWEALEARASTKTKRTAAPKPKKVESDNDEVEVLTASESSRFKVEGYEYGRPDPQTSLYGPSSALRPLPTARSSSSFSKKLTSSTSKESTLFGAPPPIELPPDERIRVLPSCPLCASAAASSSTSPGTAPLTTWGSYKSLAQRKTHLRACATKHDYTAPTVSLLISRQILSLASEAEARRSEAEASMTLFDRAIGKGEGAGAGSGRDVRVVGVEGAGGAEWHRAVKGVQEELDKERKKKGADKVVKVAKEVRKEMARLEEAEEGREQEEDEEQEGMPMPRPTGNLRPETATARNAVAQRANELLRLAGGTGLTQVAAEEDDEPVILADCDAASFVDSLLPPPPTQSFEPSTLAVRLEHDGAIDVVRSGAASLKGNGKSKEKERARSPLAELELEWSSDEDEIGTRPPSSLWKAATGKDDQAIERVVRSSAPFGSSPTSSPSTASPTSVLPFSTLSLTSPASPSPSRRSIIAGSSRNLHTSPLRRRRSSGSAKPAEQLVDELRTLGLGEPGRESPKGVGEAEPWVDGREDPWEALVLEGGAEEGRTGGGGEESSEEEPLAMIIDRTPIKKTTKRRTKTTKDDVSASTKPTTTRTRPIIVPPPSSSSDSDLLPPSTSAAKPTTVRRRRVASPSSPSSSDSDLPTTPVNAKTKSKSVSTRPPPAPPSPASEPDPSSSSDSDLLTPSTSAAKPTAVRRRRVASPSSPSSSDSDLPAPSVPLSPAADPDPPDMPAYAALSLAALRKEVAKYGFRPSKEKSVMVEQMRIIWKAMNPLPEAVNPLPEAVNPLPEAVEGGEEAEQEEGKARGRKKAKTATKTATKKVTKGKKKEVDEEEEAEEGDQQTTGERLRALIVADQALYVRVLRYEPIHIDEFASFVTGNGLKVARQLLIKFLDEQGITWYSQNPTNGSRPRWGSRSGYGSRSRR
ncbi:hypothetical protein JCM5296_003424 [Sporobolomyces johnsonii]